MTPPTVTAPTLVYVLTRAAGRCQCHGACGHPHTAGGGRCTRGAATVAPADPAVPPHVAYRVPDGMLAAWCGPCLAEAAAVWRDASATDTFTRGTAGGAL